jgi:hypothetical protein
MCITSKVHEENHDQPKKQPCQCPLYQMYTHYYYLSYQVLPQLVSYQGMGGLGSITPDKYIYIILDPLTKLWCLNKIQTPEPVFCLLHTNHLPC